MDNILLKWGHISWQLRDLSLIAVISAIATSLSGGAGGVVIAGVTAIAEMYFGQNAQWAYYYKIYNWRHSERNYYVIEETEYTQFYTDSAHNNYTGYTYYEWLDR